MPKVVSVDAAIRGNLPYVEFRGRLYQLRDFTLREQIELSLEMHEQQTTAQEEREAALAAVVEAEDDEDEDVDMDVLRERADETLAELHRVYGKAFARALDGFPAELVEDMTEREVQVLQQAIQEAREVTFPVVAESRDEVDPKMVGRASD